VREVPGPEATAFQTAPASGEVAPVPAVAAAPAPRPAGVAN
jgi:hypothetical protein